MRSTRKILNVVPAPTPAAPPQPKEAPRSRNVNSRKPKDEGK